MKQSEVKSNLDGLEKFRREIGNQYITRVGILGSHATRDSDSSINNAELGLIQIYGSITNNIPPRDFLVMPIEMKRRELVKILAGSTSREAFARGNYKRIFEIMGVAAVGFVDEAFATGGFGMWAPNKPATIRRKHSSAPLIDQAELRKAQTFDVVNKSAALLSGSRSINVSV